MRWQNLFVYHADESFKTATPLDRKVKEAAESADYDFAKTEIFLDARGLAMWFCVNVVDADDVPVDPRDVDWSGFTAAVDLAQKKIAEDEGE